MIVRRLMYRWLLPASIVLPAWLFLGWILFSRDGWGLLPLLLIFIPSVFIGQLVLALLVRSRTSARANKAVSWSDVAAFGAWHALTIFVGFYPEKVFGLVLTLAIVAALATFWLTVWELWAESRRSWATVTDTTPREERMRHAADARERTIIITESTVREAPVPVDRRGEFGQRGPVVGE